MGHQVEDIGIAPMAMAHGPWYGTIVDGTDLFSQRAKEEYSH
jgi:hypothetical protein